MYTALAQLLIMNVVAHLDQDASVNTSAHKVHVGLVSTIQFRGEGNLCI